MDVRLAPSEVIRESLRLMELARREALPQMFQRGFTEINEDFDRG